MNSAKTHPNSCFAVEEEQNLYPIYVEGEIYYLLYKDVAASSELLGMCFRAQTS